MHSRGVRGVQDAHRVCAGLPEELQHICERLVVHLLAHAPRLCILHIEPLRILTRTKPPSAIVAHIEDLDIEGVEEGQVAAETATIAHRRQLKRIRHHVK